MPKTGIPYATADLETDPFKKGGRYPLGRLPEAFCAGFFDGKLSEIFEGEKNECCRMLVDRAIQFRGIIYLHNGGKFDLHFLLTFLLEKFACEDIKPTCIGPRMVAVKTPACEFRDSFSLIPKRLKDISRAEKKEIAIWKLEKDAADLTPAEAKLFWTDVERLSITPRSVWPSPRAFYREEIISYLRQDCKGLYDAVSEFVETYGRNLTLASAAFNVLRRKFGMPVVHTRKKYDDLFRQFYFAGRVQFWELGKLEEEFKVLDINSAFPAAMMHEHWFSSGYTCTETPPLDDTKKRQSFYEITCDSFGALPIRTPKGIVFPTVNNGSFFATGWELFAALESGLVRNVRFIRVYSPAATRNFKDYVSHFYALKKDAKNVSERDFAKLFLNSSYGKFSQNPRVFTDVCITKFREKTAESMVALGWSHSYDDERRGLSFYQKPSYDKNGQDSNGRPMRFYNVCTAASITGWVRAFLMRSMHLCRGVVYCDTDSVIARDVSALKIGDGLGEWKLEQESDLAYIGGKKLYATRNKYHATCEEKKRWKKASKGVRLTVEQICKVCEGEAQSYSFEAPNYSVFSPPNFTTRTVRRDDQRRKAKVA